MGRYINPDKIRLISDFAVDGDLDILVPLTDVINAVRMTPSEDVAPRAEVARAIFEEIEKAVSSLEYKASYPHTHIPIETMTAICNWILHECVPSRLAELKKKYTEEKDDG